MSISKAVTKYFRITIPGFKQLGKILPSAWPQNFLKSTKHPVKPNDQKDQVIETELGFVQLMKKYNRQPQLLKAICYANYSPGKT